ncbi:MAG: endonuclease/exonuclease/phosphatase family protein [Pseudoalteromonas sp.]
MLNIIFYFFILFPVHTATLSDEQQGITKIASSVEQCQQQLKKSQIQTYAKHYVLPKQLHLLSWNIYKAQNQGLYEDLNELNQQADIVFLQEAIETEKLKNLKPFWRFSKGYKNGDMQSGVMTLSRWPATVHCTLTDIEPWLRSPKATNIVQYALPNQQQLLSINLHGINFTLGTDDFNHQLQNTAAIMKNHTGPIIFAGDLNAWSDDRQALIIKTLSNLGLSEAIYLDDKRTKTFGLALDQVWTRDVTIDTTQVKEVTSSDHNPILATLTIN